MIGSGKGGREGRGGEGRGGEGRGGEGRGGEGRGGRKRVNDPCHERLTGWLAGQLTF